jgi:hypothetical protein
LQDGRVFFYNLVRPHKVAVHSYRITKYNPALRDAAGAFLGSEWTSIADVGASFAGKELSLAEYERVEAAYVSAAQSFLVEASVATLQVQGVENSGGGLAAPAEGAVIEVRAIPSILVGLLRDSFWCRLESASAFVHVGYDYYMYVGVPSRCPVSERKAAEAGLFVENYSSPYARSAA